MGWHEFADLLKRNRRACAVDATHCGFTIEARYTDAAAELKSNREKFGALAAAINRIVWQLVGLARDGTHRSNLEPVSERDAADRSDRLSRIGEP